MAPKIHVYAPVIALYQSSIRVLAEAEKRLKPPGAGSQFKNFVQEWNEVADASPLLKGQQMQAVLITPMQRVPRYKMLLEQLAKDCDHPGAVPVLQKALDLFAQGAVQINESVRTFEKMEAFLGAESAQEALLTGNLLVPKPAGN
jgi:hypothetical protein